jgi:hypothetical protein
VAFACERGAAIDPVVLKNVPVTGSYCFGPIAQIPVRLAGQAAQLYPRLRQDACHPGSRRGAVDPPPWGQSMEPVPAEGAGPRVVHLGCRPATPCEEHAPVRRDRGRRIGRGDRPSFGRRCAGPGKARRQGTGSGSVERRRRRSHRDPRSPASTAEARWPRHPGLPGRTVPPEVRFDAPTTSPEARLAASEPSASSSTQLGDRRYRRTSSRERRGSARPRPNSRKPTPPSAVSRRTSVPSRADGVRDRASPRPGLETGSGRRPETIPDTQLRASPGSPGAVLAVGIDQPDRARPGCEPDHCRRPHRTGRR